MMSFFSTKISAWLARLPLLVTLIFLVGYPLYFVVVLSFGYYAGGSTVLSPPVWDYYARFFEATAQQGYFYDTFIFSIFSSLGAVLFGAALAFAFFYTDFRHKFSLLVVYLMVGISYNMLAFIGILFFKDGYFLERFWLFFFHSDEFLAKNRLVIDNFCIILLHILKQGPFVFLCLIPYCTDRFSRLHVTVAGLRVSYVKAFYRIFMPYMGKPLIWATTICFAFNILSFEIPFFMGNTYTQTLSIYIWRLLHSPGDFNRHIVAAALVSILCLVMLVLLISSCCARYWQKVFER